MSPLVCSSTTGQSLAVSQPCIRLTDVDAVGRSGRHLTTFEMMAHHVFNRPEDGLEIYWMEQCVSIAIVC